jgi:putative sigma-54 modulation protein
MQITIKGKQVEVSTRMRGHIEQKLRRLSRLLGDEGRVEVTVCEEQTRSADDRFSVHLAFADIPYSIHGSASAVNVSTALDLVLDKVAAQFGRQKDRQVTARRLPESPVKVLALARTGGVSGTEESVIDDGSLKTEENEEIWSQIMEIRRIRTSPLSGPEVIARMEREDLPFYPFFNPETNSVNVMYRLADTQGYGLLVPATE